MPSPILQPKSSSRPAPEPRSLKPLVATLLFGVGTALLLATWIDFGILWIGQHQSNSQWEFAALTSTFDNFSLVLIGLAALGASFQLRGSTSAWGARILTTLSLLFGLLTAVGCFLLATDFFDVRTKLGGPTQGAFYASVVKGLALSIIYTVTLFVTGVRGLKSR